MTIIDRFGFFTVGIIGQCNPACQGLFGKRIGLVEWQSLKALGLVSWDNAHQ